MLIYFENPLALFACPFIILIVLLLHYKGYKLYRKYSSFEHPLTRFIKFKKRKKRRVLTLVLKLSLVIILSVALAGPYTIVKEKVKRSEVMYRLEIESHPAIIVVLDASGSMGDSIGEVEKIKAAKMAIERMLDLLPENIDVGLIVFSDDVRYSIPITEHREDILLELEKVISTGGTGYGPALSSAFSWLKPYKIFNVSCAVVFVTDGMPGDKPEYEYILQSFVDYNIPIYTIYIGPSGEPGEKETAWISELTGGKHYTAEKVRELVKAFESLGEEFQELMVKGEVSLEVEVKKPLTWFFSFSVIILLALVWISRFLASRIVF